MGSRKGDSLQQISEAKSDFWDMMYLLSEFVGADINAKDLSEIYIVDYKYFTTTCFSEY